MIVPVILSGGEGKRLWPLSVADRPKQFLALTGPTTLLRQTLDRLTDAALFAEPFIIGAADHRFLIAEEVRGGGVARIVLEPCPRNTAAAAAVGALLAAQADPDGLMLLSHADHAIPDADAFRRTVAKGVAAGKAGHFVLFGVEPTFPSTGYGYIKPGAAIDAEVSAVAHFVEKPKEPAARDLIAGGALWNSGIFLMPARGFIAELERLAPDVLAAARAALERAASDADFLRLDADAFAASPSVSIDVAVMEKTQDAAVVRAGFAWSDIGAWSSVWREAAKDGDGNALRGRAVLKDSQGCLVYAEGPTVAAVGLDGFIVVATPERVLIAPMDRDQEVSDLVTRINEA